MLVVGRALDEGYPRAAAGERHQAAGGGVEAHEFGIIDRDVIAHSVAYPQRPAISDLCAPTFAPVEIYADGCRCGLGATGAEHDDLAVGRHVVGLSVVAGPAAGAVLRLERWRPADADVEHEALADALVRQETGGVLARRHRLFTVVEAVPQNAMGASGVRPGPEQRAHRASGAVDDGDADLRRLVEREGNGNMSHGTL